jgi:hypothetical protein
MKLEGEVVDALALLGRPEREQSHDLGLAAGEERGAVRPRRDANLAFDLADLVGCAPVGTPLVHGDLLPDELLVDRLGGLLDELLRQRVLDHGAVALDGRGADREGQLDGLDDPIEEEMPLRRPQLLRVLFGLGQRAQVVLELLAHRLHDLVEPQPLEDQVEARPGLRLAHDVLFG